MRFASTYEIVPPIDFNKWEKELGTEYIVLLRTHPYTTKLLGVKFNSFVRDYSNYPNINDLLIISNILISDYSSIIFDFSLLAKPFFCFAYDYEQYKRERGFIVDPKLEMPNVFCDNENELINNVLKCKQNEMVSQTIDIKNRYFQYGGNATEDCFKQVFKDIIER